MNWNPTTATPDCDWCGDCEWCHNLHRCTCGHCHNPDAACVLECGCGR